MKCSRFQASKRDTTATRTKLRDPLGAAAAGYSPLAQQDPLPSQPTSSTRSQDQPWDAAARATVWRVPRVSAAGGGGAGGHDESADPLCGPKHSLKPNRMDRDAWKSRWGRKTPSRASLSLAKHLPKSMALCSVASANEDKAVYCFSSGRADAPQRRPFACLREAACKYLGAFQGDLALTRGFCLLARCPGSRQCQGPSSPVPDGKSGITSLNSHLRLHSSLIHPSWCVFLQCPVGTGSKAGRAIPKSLVS